MEQVDLSVIDWKEYTSSRHQDKKNRFGEAEKRVYFFVFSYVNSLSSPSRLCLPQLCQDLSNATRTVFFFLSTLSTFAYYSFNITDNLKSLRLIVANLLYCDIVVSEFKLHWCYAFTLKL